MSNKIYFVTPTEIDIKALTVLGINAKEGEAPIGYFGTGFKYALAGILRLGGAVRVYTGDKKVAFGTSVHIVRDKGFELVTMTVEDEVTELGFTTTLGKHWEPWMLYRELWSNTRDEGGHVVDENGAARATDTVISVDCKEIAEAHERQKEFLITSASEVLWENPQLQVCQVPDESHCNGLFYRGIRAGHRGESWNFQFNILTELTLTEERQIASEYVAKEVLGRALCTCTNKELLTKLLTQGAEYGLDYDWHSVDPSNEFLEVATALVRQKRAIARSAKEVLKRLKPRELEAAELDIPSTWEEMKAQQPSHAPKVSASKYEWENEMDARMEALEERAKYWEACASQLAAQIEQERADARETAELFEMELEEKNLEARNDAEEEAANRFEASAEEQS